MKLNLNQFIASVALISALSVANSSAGSVFLNTTTSLTNYTEYNLTTSYNGWTIYGTMGEQTWSAGGMGSDWPGSATVRTWGGSNTSLFSALSSTSGPSGGNYFEGNGYLKLGYSNANAGSAYPNPTVSSNGSVDNFTPKFEINNVTANVSLTYTLQSNSFETVEFYVQGNGGASVDWNAVLSSGGSNLSSFTFSSASRGDNSGIISFDLIGTAGDTFTFSLNQTMGAGVSAVGISAAGAIFTAVPEPSTWALLSLGLIGMVFAVKRRNALV
jgi:hypothetical protein